MICGWCHSQFWSTLRFTTIHFIFTVVLLFWAVLTSYSVLEHIPYSVTLVVGGIPWLHQFNNFKGFSTVSYVRHIIELLSYSGSFPVLLCTWNVCLVSTLDPSFKVAGRWLRGGRTDWFGYSVVGMMCRHLMNCNIELCPDHCLVSVRFLHSAIVDCYFILCIFRYVRVCNLEVYRL